MFEFFPLYIIYQWVLVLVLGLVLVVVLLLSAVVVVILVVLLKVEVLVDIKSNITSITTSVNKDTSIQQNKLYKLFVYLSSQPKMYYNIHHKYQIYGWGLRGETKTYLTLGVVHSAVY